MNSIDEIVRAFSFLEEDLAYRQSRSEYDAASFGNAIVEFQSHDLLVRVTKDRSQFFCDFANPTRHEWFDQEILFLDMGENQAIESLVAQRWLSVDAVANSIRLTIDRISTLLRDEAYAETRARLLKRYQQRARRSV